MTEFAAEVAAELCRARSKHPRKIGSVHEAVAVIEEEFLEFRAVVYSQLRGSQQRFEMWEELVQMAAMCQRAAEDCYLDVEQYP